MAEMKRLTQKLAEVCEAQENDLIDQQALKDAVIAIEGAEIEVLVRTQ